MIVDNITTAVTLTPSAYNSSSTFTATSNTGNGLNGSGNTSSYASFSAQTSSQYAIYDFDASSIPTSATINSVSCSVRAKISSTSNFTTRTLQLYYNSTAMGNATTISSTTSRVYNLSCGTWTASQLRNVKLRITGQRSSDNNQRRIDFYGATLVVEYTVEATLYVISAVSETNLAEIAPSYQTVQSGSSVSVNLETELIDTVIVTDNGNDVTDLFLTKVKESSGETTSFPISAAASGLVYNSSSIGNASTEYQNCIGQGADTSNNTTNSVYRPSSQSTNTFITYSFDFSDIPENAIITDVSVRIKGHIESTSQSNRKAGVTLYAGNTQKGSESNFTSTSNQVLTMTAGTWSRQELQSAAMKFEIGVYGGLLVGATWTVSYTLPVTGNPYYYQYTLSGINADHDIVVAENIIIPPEEEPEKTYYPITISSINATTTPKRGTVRIESGDSQTILIYPTDPEMTLVTDNGVDISSQMVFHQGTMPSYTITPKVTGAAYGFELNSQTGYYVSTNNGVAKSASVARVNFDFPTRCLVTIEYINYAEANYDYGLFGNIDTTVSVTGLTANSGTGQSTPNDSESNYYLLCRASTYNTSSVQTLTYEIQSGTHYIDIKYGKDDATDSNNDTLQWKIASVEPLDPVSDSYYEYTVSGINQSHSLIFIFGDVQYFFITSTTSDAECKLYPSGQIVQLPGDSYRLTVVPPDSSATITITDNGSDVTQNLERKETEIEKDGDTYTAVNYIYSISNVQSAHTIQVSLVEQGNSMFLRINGIWTRCHPFKKINGEWREQPIDANIFNLSKIHMKS